MPQMAASELGLYCLLTRNSKQNTVKVPNTKLGLFQMIRMDKSTDRKKRVKILLFVVSGSEEGCKQTGERRYLC